MTNKIPYYTILFLFAFNFSFAQTDDYPHYANKESLIFYSLGVAKWADQQLLFFPVHLQYKNENIFTIITTDELLPWVETNRKGAFDTGRVQLIKILKGILVNNDTLKVYSGNFFNDYKKYEIDTALYYTLLTSDVKIILKKYLQDFYIDGLDKRKQNAIIYYLWQHNITMVLVEGPAGEDIEISVSHPDDDFPRIAPFRKLW